MSRSELQQLIAQMASKDGYLVIGAINKLRDTGWLFDGSLRGSSFQGANLYEVYIENADITDVDFTGARMHGANLNEAQAQRAIFRDADLVYVRMDEIDAAGATFDRANIRGGYITGNLKFASFQSSVMEEIIIAGDWQHTLLNNAILRNANLLGVNLSGADLSGANLQNATLRNITFDEETILPNGFNWTQHTDMSRFTHGEQ